MFCFMHFQVAAATNVIAILMRVYIPFVITFCLNMIVISRLKKSKNTVRGATQIINGKQPGKITNKEYKFKMATITIDFTFLVFYTPLAVNLTFNIVDLDDSISNDPFLNAVINNLFSNLSTLLAFSYSIALVFMFFIFNRYFREELAIILRLRQVSSQQESSLNRPI